MTERRTDKELAVELTVAVLKARADVIVSIEGNNSATQHQLTTVLNDAQATETFNQIYEAISTKTY